MQKTGRFIYDIESYSNFFSVIFKDEATREIHTFLTFFDTEDIDRSTTNLGDMIDFVERQVQWLIGYNNKEFDDIILKYITLEAGRLRKAHPKIQAQEISDLVGKLITAQRNEIKAPEFYMLSKIETTWRSLDLIQLFNPVDRVGLKRLAISLRWPTIEDLPIKPGSIIKHSDLPHLLKYNNNDVDMTERVKLEITEAINYRIAYTVKYGTDIINSSNSAIGKQIMADMYSRHMGVTFSSFRNKSTEYTSLALKDCISPKIYFTQPEFIKVLNKTREAVINPNIREEHTSVTKNGKRSKKKVKQFEVMARSRYMMHSVMLGGMHSEGPAEIMEENDYYDYTDIDVQGYYPRLICNEGLYPAHLDPKFTGILEKYIVNERVAIKKSDPVLAYLLKIAANAIFGQTDVKGKADSWLKDPKMAKYITISGQLFLIMLIEGLETYSNCIIVYSNTDGLTVRVPKIERALFQTICNRWEIYTGFSLEYTSYRKMIIRDVNNYLIFVNTDDPAKRIKAKGIYLYENTMATELKVKGVSYPIISMAVRAWYDKGTPIKDTILNCTCIYDFIKAENTSDKKFIVLLYHRNASLPDKQLQKNNRWIVTHTNPQEGRMCKISKEDGEKTEMQKGFFITPVNNIDESVPIESYRLNYDFYINQAMALTNLTKPLNKETHIEEFIQGEMF